MKNILESLEKNKFDYDEILSKSYVNISPREEILDMNVIIGVRGRAEFILPLLDSIHAAENYYNEKNKGKEKTFTVTIVEHSVAPEHKNMLDGIEDYLWTPGNIVDQYSRSFAYNFGVKYSTKAKHYILHDVDILVKENFFEEVYENLKDNKCMQTYGGRRVLYMSQELTPQVLNKSVNINTLNQNSQGVSLPMFNGQPALGSKGGSILVEREFYYELGGFDPELFWGYAAEDQIFWDKAITLLGEVSYADNPPIDIFHMWHPPTHATNPLLYEMEEYMLQFRNMKKKERMNFLNLKKELFKDGK